MYVATDRCALQITDGSAQIFGPSGALGGYTGKSSGGTPGIRVIARALPEVDAAAAALRAARAAQVRALH